MENKKNTEREISLSDFTKDILGNDDILSNKEQQEELSLLEKQRIISALPDYVPKLFKKVKKGPVIHTEPESSHLFCDQTNFTGVSELMTRLYGSGSGQTINELINEAISLSIREVRKFGGDVVQFGGDAIQVMFTGSNHEERSALAATLIQINLQKKLDEYLTKNIDNGKEVHD